MTPSPKKTFSTGTAQLGPEPPVHLFDGLLEHQVEDQPVASAL